jgi:hypothetical protein
LENLKERDHLEDLGVGGSIILKFMIGESGLRMWIVNPVIIRVPKVAGIF